KTLLKTTLLVLFMAGCSWSAVNKQGSGMMKGPSTTSDEEQWETFLRLMDDADELREITGFLDQHQDFVNSKHWWTKDTDYTPLHYAAEQGDLEVVKALIARGAEVNVKTGDDITPLHYAVASGHLDVVEYLFKVLKEQYDQEEYLDSKDNDGVSPLHIAVRGGYEDLTKLITIETPNAIKTEANDGNTALHLAAYLGSSRIVDVLLSSPAIDRAVLTKQNSGGKTPLDVAKKEEIKRKLEERLNNL
ncbi:MAG: ankyrin repeat domain-containing protein, partial [Bacteroidota bacterium]